MKVNGSTPKPSWSLVTSPSEVATMVGNKALLTGSAVFASSRDISMNGYGPLAPRQGIGLLRSFYAKEVLRLHVAVHEAVLRNAPRGARFALAIDGYMQWGLRSKGKVILIGGCDSAHESSLDVLFFEDGRFKDYASKLLPGTQAGHYAETVTAMLDGFAASHPGYKIHQAAPLKAFGPSFPMVQYIADKPLKRLSFRPLSLHVSQRVNHLTVPAAMIACSVLFYAGAVGRGWSEYSGAKAAYEQEVADPLVQGKGGVDSGLIDTILQRRFFLDEPRRQVLLSEKSKNLVTGVGMLEGLRIVEIKLPAPSVATPGAVGVPTAGVPAKGGEREPDVWLRVSVPLQAEGAMVQGKAVMQAISANTGMSVRLARQGWTDDGKRRVFTIEGFIHG